MATLRSAEAALGSGRAPAADAGAIAKAAGALIDISPGETLTRGDAKAVYDHWHKSLTSVFPNVMEEFGPGVKQRLLSTPVPGEEHQTLGDWIGMRV